MSAKSPATRQPWVDAHDAPTPGPAHPQEAPRMVAARAVSREGHAAAVKAVAKMGRPRLERPKRPLTVRYDADVIDAFKATGPGWQTRMNDALRDWLNTHPGAAPSAR